LKIQHVRRWLLCSPSAVRISNQYLLQCIVSFQQTNIQLFSENH
jgi:hypothetical protein